MTKNELTRRFKHASQAFIRANCQADPERIPDPEPQPDPKQPLVGTLSAQKQGLDRIGVSYTSYRVKLVDRTNLVGGLKSLEDGLVAAGLLPGDSEAEISIQWKQVRVRTFKEEMTVIEITYP